MDNDKNIKKLLRSRSLDFLLFHLKGKSAKSLRNAWTKSVRNAYEKIVYNKFQVYSLQM